MVNSGFCGSSGEHFVRFAVSRRVEAPHRTTGPAPRSTTRRACDSRSPLNLFKLRKNFENLSEANGMLLQSQKKFDSENLCKISQF